MNAADARAWAEYESALSGVDDAWEEAAGEQVPPVEVIDTLTEHWPVMTGPGTAPMCACGWRNPLRTGPLLADHLRETGAL